MHYREEKKRRKNMSVASSSYVHIECILNSRFLFFLPLLPTGATQGSSWHAPVTKDASNRSAVSTCEPFCCCWEALPKSCTDGLEEDEGGRQLMTTFLATVPQSCPPKHDKRWRAAAFQNELHFAVHSSCSFLRQLINFLSQGGTPFQLMRLEHQKIKRNLKGLTKSQLPAHLGPSIFHWKASYVNCHFFFSFLFLVAY